MTFAAPETLEIYFFKNLWVFLPTYAIEMDIFLIHFFSYIVNLPAVDITLKSHQVKQPLLCPNVLIPEAKLQVTQIQHLLRNFQRQLCM